MKKEYLLLLLHSSWSLHSWVTALLQSHQEPTRELKYTGQNTVERTQNRVE